MSKQQNNPSAPCIVCGSPIFEGDNLEKCLKCGELTCESCFDRRHACDSAYWQRHGTCKPRGISSEKYELARKMLEKSLDENKNDIMIENIGLYSLGDEEK